MAGAARWDGLAIRLHQSLLCPHRLMLGPSPRCRHAQAPKSPAVCSRPPFPLPPVSLSAPSPAPPPDTLLFSLLPPHAFLLFTVCYSSSFLTSRLPPRCRRRLLPRSVVQHVSPVRKARCLMFVRREWKVRTSFKYLFYISFYSSEGDEGRGQTKRE